MSEPAVAVVHLLSWLPVGGVERQLLDILARLDRGAFLPSICCLRERGPLADEAAARGIPVSVVRQRSRLHPVTLLRLAAHLRRAGAGLVHAHMYRAATTGAVAARLAGRPAFVYTVHTVRPWDDRRQAWTDRCLSPWRDAVVAVSQAVGRAYAARVPLPPGKLRVIPNGVDVAAIRDRLERSRGPDQPSLRQALGLPADRPLIGAVGRLIDDKGHAVLLRAFARLAPAFPGADLVLAGDGPRRADLERLASDLGVAPRVHFLGTIDRVPELLGELTAMALPSFREGMSLVLLEGLAAGCPVVATRVGGNPEAIREGESGFLIEPGDDATLAHRLAAILGQPELAGRLRAGAVAAADGFDLGRTVSALEGLYHELLERRSGGPGPRPVEGRGR